MSTIRPEARRMLRDIRWINTANRYIAAAEAELAASPNDKQLMALIKMMREVISKERQRILDAA